MTTARPRDGEEGTVRERLIRAADAEIAERGTSSVQMETVALRAGVSRATAFRQLGSVSDMLMEVSLLRGRRHVAAVQALMATKTGTFAKLEAALLYTTRELPADPTFSALVTQRGRSIGNPGVHDLSVEALGPVIREGQRCGEVRTDLEVDELVDFVLEQMYLAADHVDRSDAAVRRRMRHFIVPALAAQRREAAEHIQLTQEAQEAVDAAIEADQPGRPVAALTLTLPRRQGYPDRSRNSRRRILPVTVFGSASTIST
jgi:AcrR family transcriptional regulator